MKFRDPSDERALHVMILLVKILSIPRIVYTSYSPYHTVLPPLITQHVGGRRALYLDEISTGLDSATLYNIVAVLGRVAR